MPHVTDLSLEATLAGVFELVRSVDAEVLVQVSLDGQGNILDVECLASHSAPKNGIPLALLLERPLAAGARCVTFISSNPGDEITEGDVDLTRRLLQEARSCDLGVVDHHLVGESRVLSLRAGSDLWSH